MPALLGSGGPPRFDRALALIASHEAAFRRTARRHSLCADDADDAYQRAVEILLTKAPECEPPRLAAWMHTVTRHEAMAVRRARERLLGAQPGRGDGEPGGLDGLPGDSPGPAERAERRERVARSSEALARLKPQERRALALKAEGFSYAQIRALTGWTYTKVNRCMAEGRKRFLEIFATIEDGRRCEELAGALAALAAGARPSGSRAPVADRDPLAPEELGRHLRSCARCRALARNRPLDSYPFPT